VTVLEPTRRVATRSTPVRVDTLTGPLEAVLYAVGYARRVGALVRTDNPVESRDGTVTVRVWHTLVVPLVVPQLGEPVDMRNTRDWVDYVELGLRVAPWAIGLSIVGVSWWAIGRMLSWFGAHSVAITGGIDTLLAIGIVVVLLMLCGGGKGGGCVGLHCGGCKG
jgi:hypothetical protein